MSDPRSPQVLGRHVYTSNMQLGGPEIMHYNGKAVSPFLHTARARRQSPAEPWNGRGSFSVLGQNTGVNVANIKQSPQRDNGHVFAYRWILFFLAGSGSCLKRRRSLHYYNNYNSDFFHCMTCQHCQHFGDQTLAISAQVTRRLNRHDFSILGVSHLVVPDDFGGVSAIMQWLSYVPRVSCSQMFPKKRNAPAAVAALWTSSSAASRWSMHHS